MKLPRSLTQLSNLKHCFLVKDSFGITWKPVTESLAYSFGFGVSQDIPDSSLDKQVVDVI